MFKHTIFKIRKYFFIALSTSIFLSISFSASFSKENVFIIDEVEVEGEVDLNFSRDKYINKAFSDSFQILISRILLTKDLNKISNMKLEKIKNLISNFQVIEENYKKNRYKAVFKIFYDDIKVKKLLGKKNISFSQPKKISAVFFPILFVDGEFQNFNDSFFYKKWTSIKIKNELINFILPLEDLDDIAKIQEMKNNIEELNVDDLVNKYNIKNYVFTLMDHQNNQLNVYLKTNFNNNQISKNLFYELNDSSNQTKLKFILKDLKEKITDIWKSENVINLATPLIIRIKFKHNNLKNLDKFKNTIRKISIIENSSLEELNIKNSFFKIYYYGDPKRLKMELSKFGYKLNDQQGHWEIYVND